MYLLAFLPQLPLILFFFFWLGQTILHLWHFFVQLVLFLFFWFFAFRIWQSFILVSLCSFCAAFTVCVCVFFFRCFVCQFHALFVRFAICLCFLFDLVRHSFLLFFDFFSFYFCFGFSPAVDFAPLFWVESLIFLYFWPICGAQCKQTQSIVQHIDTNVSATRRSYLFFSFLLLLSPFFCVLGVEVTNDWQLFNMALIEFLIVWLFTCWLPFLHEISLHLREAL